MWGADIINKAVTLVPYCYCAIAAYVTMSPMDGL